MNEILNASSQKFTYICDGVHLKGEFFFDGDTKLAGLCEGQIHLNAGTESNLLSIEPTGEVKGKVNAQNIQIYGRVTGEVYSDGTVTLYPSSHFEGILNAKNIVIHPGSTVNMNGHTDI